jgi:hypothetical protein
VNVVMIMMGKTKGIVSLEGLFLECIWLC